MRSQLAAVRDLFSEPSFQVVHTRENSQVVRTLEGAATFRSTVQRCHAGRGSLAIDFDWHWLRSPSWPKVESPRGFLKVADLFCGSGGLSLGAWEAARAVQLEMKSVFAVDNDADAIAVYSDNFAPLHSETGEIELLVDGQLGAKITASERRLVTQVGELDLLLAGPPCQGHSDLNNYTRRNDPRNELLLRVIRFAELFSPRHIVIENVQGVRHDRAGVFHKAEQKLVSLGYQVASFLLEGDKVGLPQRRRRCVLLASRSTSFDATRLISMNSSLERSFDWACSDLENIRADSVFDTSANVFPENQRRMEYLIENDIFDLPDAERPDCHRLKSHDYRAVYGRLRPEQPAPTITTGFGSPGQGRFTHPRFARTITPHEAARLQFIPDFFRFRISKRKRLQKLIGNSVPPKMAYAAVLDMLCHD